VEDEETFSLSAKYFKYWVIDRARREIRVIFQDGRETSEPIAADDPILDSEVAVSIFDWEKWWIHSVTKRNHLVFSEGYSPYTKDPLGGRPVVYLDQNHWSTVAYATLAPDRVRSKSELAAAYEVIRFASDAGIVLPLSAGHMLETGGLYGDRRYEVGVTMAALSGGWQLRHPMTVWHQEAAALLASVLEADLPAKMDLPVITLDPNALLSSGKRPEDLDPNSSELLLLAMSSPGVLVDLLLDPERDERTEDTIWVDHHMKITSHFARLPDSKEAKRRIARRRFWNENLGIIHQEYRRFQTTKPLPGFSDKDLARLLELTPMVTYLSGLFVQRFLAKQTQWKRNDLFDMLYLSCAAGYADYVVAEAHTGTQLAQMQKTHGSSLTTFTTLVQLVEALHSAGVQTAAERETRRAGL
jgi:hypothetical protein